MKSLDIEILEKIDSNFEQVEQKLKVGTLQHKKIDSLKKDIDLLRKSIKKLVYVKKKELDDKQKLRKAEAIEPLF